MFTVSGGLTVLLSLAIAMETPPEGAGAVSATAPEKVRPPSTLAGEIVKLLSCGRLDGSIAKSAETVTPCAAAVRLPVCRVTTLVVVTVVCTDAFPSGIVTGDGTTAARFVVRSPTGNPPKRARPFRKIVAVMLSPPVTVDGESTTLASCNALAGIDAISKVTVLEAASSVAIVSDTTPAPSRSGERTMLT